MGTMLTRRRLLGTGLVLGAAGLAGCRPALPNVLRRRTPLHIHLLGLPPQDVELAALIRGCVLAYESARRGAIAVTTTTSVVPPPSWYSCPKGVGNDCLPGSLPASLAPPFKNFYDTPPVQIEVDTGAYEVRGRTRLGTRFGEGTLEPLVETAVTSALPDIIIAYDLWQYALTGAAFATDISETWRTISDDRSGVADVERFAHFFDPSRGTFPAAFPVLRNPLVIANSGTITPWDWATVQEGLAHGDFDTSRFLASPLYPAATDLAASLVVACGGTVGHATATACAGTFTSPQGTQALALAAGLARPTSAAERGAPPGPPVFPAYMWNPLGGVRASFGLPGDHFWPLPAGPARTATPCTYLCATVVASGTQVAAALDFASFLMNPASQSQLGTWAGGLPLRAERAEAVLADRCPWLTAPFAQALAAGSTDLTAGDLYGGEETAANRSAYDGVADAFAAALVGAQTTPEAGGP